MLNSMIDSIYLCLFVINHFSPWHKMTYPVATPHEVGTHFTLNINIIVSTYFIVVTSGKHCLFRVLLSTSLTTDLHSLHSSATH